MNSFIAHRTTRVSMRVYSTLVRNVSPARKIELLSGNQLRRFSESKLTSKMPRNKSIPASRQSAGSSLRTSSSPIQKLLDYWNAPSQTSGRDDASLARYPNWQTPGGLLRGADYMGTITFALTGTITAAQSGLDVFGSVVVGTITAVGGGTIRDAIFLNRKPFWTEETEYIWMGLVTGLITFFIWPTSILEWQQAKQRELEQQRNNGDQNTLSNDDDDESSEASYDTVDGVLDTLDAIGLSAFAIIGAQNGIRAGMPLLVSAICGMTTATFGGLIRDVLCGRPVRIIHSNTEVYAPPALAGAMVYLMTKTAGGSPALRIGAAFATCMGSRFLAVQNDVKLHTWDTNQDNLGVTVRKKPTKTRSYRND